MYSCFCTHTLARSTTLAYTRTNHRPNPMRMRGSWTQMSLGGWWVEFIRCRGLKNSLRNSTLEIKGNHSFYNRYYPVPCRSGQTTEVRLARDFSLIIVEFIALMPTRALAARFTANFKYNCSSFYFFLGDSSYCLLCVSMAHLQQLLRLQQEKKI